jgi:hypothetical protein
MRFNQYLQEEWDSSIKIAWSGGKYYTFDIYRNPTSSDYIDLRKNNGGRGGVRAIVDAGKEIVYVFPDDILHYLVVGKLELDKQKLFAGAGIIEGNKIKLSTFGFYGDWGGQKLISFHNRKLRKFMDKYFINLSYWDDVFV